MHVLGCQTDFGLFLPDFKYFKKSICIGLFLNYFRVFFRAERAGIPGGAARGAIQA